MADLVTKGDLVTVLRKTADLVEGFDMEEQTVSVPLIKLFRDAADCIDSYRRCDEASARLHETQKKLIDAMQDQIVDYKALVDLKDRRIAELGGSPCPN